MQINTDNKKDETQNMSASNNKVSIEATGDMLETNSSAETAAGQIMRTLANNSERRVRASDVHVIGPTFSSSQPNIAFNNNAMSASVPLSPLLKKHCLDQTVFFQQRTVSGMMNSSSHQTYDMDKVMASKRQSLVAAKNYMNMEIVSLHLRS